MKFYTGVQEFTAQLEAKNVPYAVIGGLAVFAYGGERTTFDIDFLVPGIQRESVKSIASNLGFKIVNENTEVLQLSGPTQVDIIFANRPPTLKMLESCRKIDTLPFPVVAPEDLIGLKIQAFVGDRKREFIDKGDILTLMRTIPRLNFQTIKEYAEIFDVWTEIEDLKKRI